MKWTRFMDMHSGGGCKESPYEKILIEAPKKEAKVIFYNKFGHNPERVTCTCCGDDYIISEHDTLEQATAYDRGCAYDDKLRQYVEKESTEQYRKPYLTIEQYKNLPDVLIISTNQIADSERIGEVPKQGYVW